MSELDDELVLKEENPTIAKLLDQTDDFGDPIAPSEPSGETPPKPTEEDEVVLSSDDSLLESESGSDAKEQAKEKKPTTPEGSDPSLEKKDEDAPPVLKQHEPPTPGSREAVLKELGADDADTLAAAKQMSNDAFNKHVEVIKRAKDYEAKVAEFEKNGGSTLPTSYFDHELGYTLNPEFKKSETLVNQVKLELAHWEKQRKLIEEGEDWEDLSYDQNTGRYTTIPKKADARSEALVLQQISALNSYGNQEIAKMNAMQKEFSEARQKRVNVFKDWEDHMFPDYKGKEASNDHIKKISTFFDKQGLSTNPLSGMFAKLYAFAMETQARAEKASSDLAIALKNQKPATHQPTDDEINTSVPKAPPAKGSKEETLAEVDAEFDALING